MLLPKHSTCCSAETHVTFIANSLATGLNVPSWSPDISNQSLQRRSKLNASCDTLPPFWEISRNRSSDVPGVERHREGMRCQHQPRQGPLLSMRARYQKRYSVATGFRACVKAISMCIRWSFPRPTAKEKAFVTIDALRYSRTLLFAVLDTSLVPRSPY